MTKEEFEALLLKKGFRKNNPCYNSYYLYIVDANHNECKGIITLRVSNNLDRL